jgi:hypothetical protein
MMTTSEKATQKSITLPTRSVHPTSFLWALCQELVLSTTHRSVAQNGAGLPFFGDLGFKPAFFEALAGGLRIVPTIEMDVRPLG